MKISLNLEEIEFFLNERFVRKNTTVFDRNRMKKALLQKIEFEDLMLGMAKIFLDFCWVSANTGAILWDLMTMSGAYHLKMDINKDYLKLSKMSDDYVNSIDTEGINCDIGVYFLFENPKYFFEFLSFHQKKDYVCLLHGFFCYMHINKEIDYGENIIWRN